jgi:copper chaperone CopZ
MISNTDLKGAAVPAPIVAGAGDRPAALQFDLAHHLPGRLRLRSAVLKGNALASEEARRHLAQIDGVTSAQANPSTGSVLLEYDPNVISPSNVSDVLATHGYALGPTEAETEAGAGWADKLARAAWDWAINALAERLALAMISALA